MQEWAEAKKAGTYGEGNALPVWITDDGKILNQSFSILRMLAT